MISLIHHPDDKQRMGDLLVENLSNGKWEIFRAAIAFVKTSGVKHIKAALASFVMQGEVIVSAGIDHAGTSKEGLVELLEALGTKGVAWVFQNAGARSTFHPKVYLFENATEAECFIGSGNLTEGGLYTNYEAFVHLKLKKTETEDVAALERLNSILDTWTDASGDVALRLDSALIEDLVDKGILPTEAQISQARGEVNEKIHSGAKHGKAGSPFGSKQIQAAPKVASVRKPSAGGTVSATLSGLSGFFMTLQQTDVGVGQITRGTSKRSPEIFIPLAARNANAGFWGWSNLFDEDSTKPGKYDRTNVPMWLNGRIIHVNMMTWPDKSDFRLRNSELRDAGSVDDILRIIKVDGRAGYDYIAEVVGQSSPKYAQYAAICTSTVRNSRKRWGYR